MRGTTLAALGACLGALSGCASPTGDAMVRVPAGRYAEAFDITKDVLRESHFELDRIDARSGTITTYPRASSGYATPWIDHASTSDQALSGLLNRERRQATVTFVASVEGNDTDLWNAEAVTQSVEVMVERIHKRGRRVDSVSARAVTYTVDPLDHPDRGSRDVVAEFETVGRDDALAARIAKKIQSRLDDVAPGETTRDKGNLDRVAESPTR